MKHTQQKTSVREVFAEGRPPLSAWEMELSCYLFTDIIGISYPPHWSQLSLLWLSRTALSGDRGTEKKLAWSILLSTLTQTWWENPLQGRIHIPIRHKAALTHRSAAPGAAGACEWDPQIRGTASVLLRRHQNSCASAPGAGWALQAGGAAARCSLQRARRGSGAVGSAAVRLGRSRRGYGVGGVSVSQAAVVYTWLRGREEPLPQLVGGREPLLLHHWFQVHLGTLCACVTNACLRSLDKVGKCLIQENKGEKLLSLCWRQVCGWTCWSSQKEMSDVQKELLTDLGGEKQRRVKRGDREEFCGFRREEELN